MKSISWLLDSSTRIRSGLGVVWAAGGGGVGAVEGCLDLKDSNSSETSWWAGAAPDGDGEVVFCAALESISVSFKVSCKMGHFKWLH